MASTSFGLLSPPTGLELAQGTPSSKHSFQVLRVCLQCFISSLSSAFDTYYTKLQELDCDEEALDEALENLEPLFDAFEERTTIVQASSLYVTHIPFHLRLDTCRFGLFPEC